MSSDAAPKPPLTSKHSEAYPSESAERERDTARAPAPEVADTRSLAYHPLSLIILTIWVAYIAVLIWLLEHSTRLAEKYPQPGWTNRLTSAALVGFAQFHTAVTVMHLGRLTVSVLHRNGPPPPQSTKVYWLNNRKWGGPVSVSSTLLTKLTSLPNHRFSITFALFSITCLMTLPTPYLLGRGYEERSLEVARQTTVVANTFTQNSLPELNAWMQMSTGEGAWVTDLPITDVYNSSLFVHGNQTRDDTAHTVVLAGSLAGWRVPTLSSVQVQSDCGVYNGMPDPSETFLSWCDRTLPGTKYSHRSSFTAGAKNSINQNISWCTDHEINNTMWMSTLETSSITAYIRFIATDNASDSTPQVSGMIKCASSFFMGTADADGRYNNFSTFTPSPYNMDTQLQPPLFAALYDLTMPFGVTDNTGTFEGVGIQRVYSILNILGYTTAAASGEYKQPTLDTLADKLQRGTMCMGAAIGALAKRPNQTISDVTEYYTVTGRVRDPPYIWAGVGLLIAWLLMIVFCTIRMFRPTSSAALDIYFEKEVAANQKRLSSGAGKLVDTLLKDQ